MDIDQMLLTGTKEPIDPEYYESAFRGFNKMLWTAVAIMGTLALIALLFGG